MDAFLEGDQKRGEDNIQKADLFLEKTRDIDESKHKSVGYGYDHRFEGECIIGSSLIFQGMVIHGAFFQIPG